MNKKLYWGLGTLAILLIGVSLGNPTDTPDRYHPKKGLHRRRPSKRSCRPDATSGFKG